MNVGYYGGALTATVYSGEFTMIRNAQIVVEEGETGFKYDDGTFIRFDDDSIVEAT